MKKLIATLMAGLMYGAWGGPAKAADPAPGRNRIGINLRTMQDWETTRLFADILKMARQWTRPNSSAFATLDTRGWPTEDAETLLFDNSAMDGTYRLSFAGQGDQVGGTITATVIGASVQASTWHYDSVSKRTSVQFRLDYSGRTTVTLRFTNTSGGISDVKVMCPRTQGGTTPHDDTDVVTDAFRAAVAPFGVLRGPGCTGGLYNPVELTWEDRIPADASTNWELPDNFAGRGMSWEQFIKLANAVHKDLWINVPARCDGEYVTSLAELFRYGSDAEGMPYDAPQAAPVHPPLDEDLNLYVEYSNELWNDESVYEGAWSLEQVRTENGTYRYDYDGTNSEFYWRYRRTARRAAEVSLAFRDVFGADEMLGGSIGRIRPLLLGQFSQSDAVFSGLQYLEDYYLPHYGITLPLPSIFYGAGGGPYYSPASGSTLSTLWDSSEMNASGEWGQEVVKDVRVSVAFGLQPLAYEGGPALGTVSQAVGEAAVNDPRMGDELFEHHKVWSEAGGGLFVYTNLAQNYVGGFTPDVYQNDTVKLVAAGQLAASARDTPTYGNAVPSSVDGNAFHLSYLSYATPGSGTKGLSEGQWTAYIFNVPLDGVYVSTITYQSASGRLALMVDGVEAAAKAATGNGILAATATLSKGLHSIRAKITGGSISIASVSMEPGNIADTHKPTAPQNLRTTS